VAPRQHTKAFASTVKSDAFERAAVEKAAEVKALAGVIVAHGVRQQDVESGPGVVSSPSVGGDRQARRLPRQQGRIPHPLGSWLGRLGRGRRPLAVVAAHWVETI